MQISHKTCRSRAAGQAGSPPPNGKMRLRTGQARGPGPAPALLPTSRARPPRGGPGWKAGQANRQRPPRKETDPAVAFPRGPSRKPLPHSRPGPAPSPDTPPHALPRWSLFLYPGNLTQTSSVGFSQSNTNHKKQTKNFPKSNNRQEK